jgi:uncharacterized protein YfaS (alpha-2-macroglobulin family)
VGTALVVQVVDQTGTPIDVSGASARTIYLTRPDGTVLTKTAVNDTTGADGRIRYTTQAGDISQTGRWRIQAYVAGVGGFSGSTREASFEVFKSRRT